MTLDRQETIQVQCEFRHVKNKICRIRKCRNTFRTDGRPHLPRPSGFARRIRPTSELRGRGDIISHHRGKNYVRQRMGPNKIQKGQLILDLGVMEDLDLQLHNVPNILSLSGHAEYTRTLQNPCGSSPVTRSLKASRHETVNPQSYPPSDFLLPLHLVHNDRVYYIQLVAYIKVHVMWELHCTRHCIRNKTFLFVKIESWYFQYLHETSQNFIYIFWQTKKFC